MKNSHFMILVLTVLGLGAIFTHGPQRAAAAASTAHAAIPPLITTARPGRRQFSLQLPWNGVVEPDAAVNIIAPLDGRVTALEAADQSRIDRGRPVARLGGPQIEATSARLAAKIKSLQARLKLAGQTVAQLQQNLKARLATNQQVEAAQGVQLQVQGQLAALRVDMRAFAKNLLLSAPINGVFTRRRVSVGQDVQAGQVIAEIIDTSHLRIAASLFPTSSRNLTGLKAFVRLDANQTIPGTVRRLLPERSDTGAVKVWIEGPQIDKKLRPGQTVSGLITLEVRSGLAVPQSAIVYDDHEEPYVFIARHGKYKSRHIRPGLSQNGWVEIISGVRPEQDVVVRGAYELFYKEFSRQFKVQD